MEQPVAEQPNSPSSGFAGVSVASGNEPVADEVKAVGCGVDVAPRVTPRHHESVWALHKGVWHARRQSMRLQVVEDAIGYKGTVIAGGWARPELVLRTADVAMRWCEFMADKLAQRVKAVA